jgi:DNA polymerase-3 subunit delta
MPSHVIYGDSFLVAERLRRVKSETGASDLMDSNRHLVTAARARPDEVLAMCNSLPFLDPMRLVEIEGVLAAQQGSGGARGSARRAASASGVWTQLVDSVPTLPETTLLIFVDGDVQQSNPLLRSLAEHCTVHRESTPNVQGLLQWIKRRAADKGSSITPPAMQVLAELVGGDLWTIDRELEKLSLYATGRDITDSDVRAMVPYAQEANIFAAVDAIMDGKPGPALRLLMQLMEDGQEPLYIIAMIERQLRLIALARDLTDRGVSPPDLGRRMGTNSDFVLRKTLGQARRLTLPQIRTKYRRVLESDLAIKQGRLEPALSLQLLVADLAINP